MEAVRSPRMIKHAVTGVEVPYRSVLGDATREFNRKHRETADLAAFIPDPKGQATRNMVAIDPESFATITTLAKEMNTTKGKIVMALTKHYMKTH